MIELTAEQRQELSQPEPVAINPETRERYVLVRAEVYERLARPLVADAAALAGLGWAPPVTTASGLEQLMRSGDA